MSKCGDKNCKQCYPDKTKFKVGDKVKLLKTKTTHGGATTLQQNASYGVTGRLGYEAFLLERENIKECEATVLVTYTKYQDVNLSEPVYGVSLPFYVSYGHKLHGLCENGHGLYFAESELAAGVPVKKPMKKRQIEGEVYEADDYWQGERAHFIVETIESGNYGWKVNGEIVLDGFPTLKQAGKALYRRVHPPVPLPKKKMNLS